MTPVERQKVEPFVATAFGVPSQPISEDHLEAYLAEVLWYLAVQDWQFERTGTALRHVEPPGFTVTDSGPDGLAIYAGADQSLTFVLWEIKKHLSDAHVSRTIGLACRQLDAQALKYLAKYVAVGPSGGAAADIVTFFERLVDFWADETGEAGVGVALATTVDRAPKRKSFGTLKSKFPNLSREGIVIATKDFNAFCKEVRKVVWSGL